MGMTMFSKADRFNLRSRSFSGECVDRSMDQRCWWWLNRQAPRVVKQRKARIEHAQKGKVSVQDYPRSNPQHHQRPSIQQQQTSTDVDTMLSPSFSGKSGKVKGGGLDLTLSAEAGFDCFRRRDCCSSSSWGGDDMGVGCTANDGERGR